jgi:hypothetical protein
VWGLKVDVLLVGSGVRNKMQTKTPWLGIILFVLFVFGLVTWLSHKTIYSEMAGLEIPLQINTSEPQLYKIRLLYERRPLQNLDDEGKIILRIPGTCREDHYILGIRYAGDDDDQEQVVEVIKNDAVIKRLSLGELYALPTRNGRYHYLDL